MAAPMGIRRFPGRFPTFFKNSWSGQCSPTGFRAFARRGRVKAFKTSFYTLLLLLRCRLVYLHLDGQRITFVS